MKFLITVALSIVLVKLTYAQAPFVEWNKTNNNPNIASSFESPTGITSTNDGGFVITGNSTQSNPYAFIHNTKFDQSGAIVWTNQYNLSAGYRNTGGKIRATSDGGLITVGSSEEGGGPSFNYFNMYILKTNALGVQTWVAYFGKTLSIENGLDIRELPDGSFIAIGLSRAVGGDITSNAGAADLWAIKISATGTKLWSKSYGTALDEVGNGLVITNDGNCVIAGKSGTDGYVIKLNSTTGDLIWSKTIGSNNTDVFNNVIENANGDLTICGTTNSTTGFALANHGLQEVWVLKTSSIGDIIWNKIFGSTGDDGATSLLLDNDGGVIVVGNSGAVNGDVSFGRGGSDEWILKLDTNGNLIWEKSIGSTVTESGVDIVKSINGFTTLSYTNQLNTNGDILCPKGYFWTVKFNNSQTPPQGKKLWLRADAGVFNSNVALAADGETVLNWVDQDCGGLVATQPTSSRRPVYQQFAFNGKPAIFFDGVNGDYWLQNTVSSPVPTSGGARTYFIVAKAACNASGYTGGYLYSNRLTANASTIEFTKNGTSIFHGGNLCCNHPEATTVAFESGRDQPFFATWRTGGTGTNLDFWFNGTSQTTANANFVADNGTAGFAIGDRRDGQSPIGSYDWQGHIAEVIVYDRALTDAERIATENYLKLKYFTGNTTTQFTTLPTEPTFLSNSNFIDATWKHTFNTSANIKLISSVKDNCLNLGTINSTVYNDAAVTLNGGKYTMQRHYTISTTLSPVGTKRVRLYYTNTDFVNLQAVEPSLTTASDLVVTKYTGTNEDGIYNPTGGSLTFIPSSQIVTGATFGVNFLEFDVSTFGEFWIHTGQFGLPITLTSFTAKPINTATLLNWNTATEYNNKGFNVEHSSDGIAFTNIAFVKGKGNNLNNTTYSYIHNNPVVGKNYYRLQAVDYNGKETVSPIVIVNLKNISYSLSIFPNPTTGIVNIINSSKITSLELLNITGASVKKYTTIQPIINLTYLPNGTYILRATLADGRVVNEKVVLEK